MLITVAVVITLIAAGAALAWMSSHGTGGSRATATPAPRRPSSGPATPSWQGSPQLPGMNLTSLRWMDFHGVELPVSPVAGPRDMRNGLASGFADTPLGALLAALNIGVRANAQWGPAIFGPVIRGQVTGPDAPALLASCQAAYSQGRQAAGVPAGQPLGRAYVVEEAFRWVAYTPADATVDIVSAGPGSQGVTVRAATRIEVQRTGGDWRVVAPPGGDWRNSAAPLPSPSGYTFFPGQG
jgi:hypothetical protein